VRLGREKQRGRFVQSGAWEALEFPWHRHEDDFLDITLLELDAMGNEVWPSAASA
jgi:hypothetical protein